MPQFKNSLRNFMLSTPPRWIIAKLSILFAIIIIYAAYQGIIKWPNGDEGIYLSGGYHLANGNYPHVDHWWPQGIGINFLVALWGKLFGFDLLVMRILSLLCLTIAIGISGWIIWQNIDIQNKSLPFLLFSLCGLASQVVILYFGSGLGTKEGVLSLLLILTVCTYLQFIKNDSRSNLFAFCSSVFFLILFKPNLIFALSFFAFHSINIGKSALVIAKAAILIAATLFILYFFIFGDLAGFEKLFRDISQTAKDIGLRGYGLGDALRLLGQSVFVVILSIAFVILAPKHLYPGPFTHPGTIILGYWLTNLVFTVIIFYPGLFPVYFYQFNILLTLGLLIYVGRTRWHASTPALLVMAVLVYTNFILQVSNKMHGWDFERATGYFKSETIINHLNKLPKDDVGYLFIGRHQHLVLESAQKQSVYSVGGTVNMDLLIPDRETANDMKVIAMSNISGLLQKHEMIIYQKTAKKKFKDIDFEALLDNYAFKLETCDEVACFYLKQERDSARAHSMDHIR